MKGKQLTTFTVTVVCLVVSSLVVSLRTFVRLSISTFGVDDGLMAVGQVMLPPQTRMGIPPLTMYSFFTSVHA